MPLIATLVSNPAGHALSPALANMAAKAASASDVRWLADGVACDIALPDGAAHAQALAALRAALDGEPVDVAVQEQAGRRKKILIADMDSTMIDQECIDELADEVGLKAHVAAITARSMNGEIAFEPALRERVALLKDLDTAVVGRIVERFPVHNSAVVVVQIEQGELGEPDEPLLYHERRYHRPSELD